MGFPLPHDQTLDRAALTALQRRQLAELLRIVRAAGGFYARKLDGVAFDPAVDPMARLPLTTRAEIEADQLAEPPFGTLPTVPLASCNRVHQTSGSSGTPLRWLDTPETWSGWQHCWSTIYDAAELSPADALMYPFSFGPFIGFWSAYDAAARRGHLVIPGGGMTTSARLRAIVDYDAAGVCCTPTYALRMAEVAADEGIDLRAAPVRALIVAGEPGGSVPATRARIEAAWGARVFDHAGMTEMGAWGFECMAAPGGLHVIEDAYIAEVLDPDTLQAVPAGRPGELVLTNLRRSAMPLIRYRTGDLVVPDAAGCPCGRTWTRYEGGIRGRIDDMLVIRGNNVFPAAIEGILRRFDEVVEFQLAVRQRGDLTDLEVIVEPRRGSAPEVADDIAAAIQHQLHFSPQVRLVEPDTLPRYDMKARRVVREPLDGEKR